MSLLEEQFGPYLGSPREPFRILLKAKLFQSQADETLSILKRGADFSPEKPDWDSTPLRDNEGVELDAIIFHE